MINYFQNISSGTFRVFFRILEFSNDKERGSGGEPGRVGGLFGGVGIGIGPDIVEF